MKTIAGIFAATVLTLGMWTAKNHGDVGRTMDEIGQNLGPATEAFMKGAQGLGGELWRHRPALIP